MTWTVLGIDPAPRRDAGVVCNGSVDTDRPKVPPTQLRSLIDNTLQTHDPVLIAWDAPLSFHPNDFYDRPIDYAARRWLQGQGRKLEKKAAAAAPFANLSHWAVTCSALGFPFGSRPCNLQLAPVDLRRKTESGAYLIEVHPSLALAIWWLEREGETMPNYRLSKTVCRRIVGRLQEPLANPPDLDWDSDLLDAYVAWRLAEDFLDGNARWVGAPETGGYVLPNCRASDEIDAGYGTALQQWDRGPVPRRHRAHPPA